MSTALAKSNESAGIERARLVDPMSEWEAMRQQAKALVTSGFLPKAINTPEKAIAVMQTGRELGIGPMQALRCIHIIDGKPSMAAELIAGLVLSRIPGSTLRPIESTDQRCVVEAARPGQNVMKFSFSLEDAAKAGLNSKDNWRKYPRAMLRSRAITEAARAVFPDATMGLYDPDELGAITGETGELIEMPAAIVTEVKDTPREKSKPTQTTDEPTVQFGKNKGTPVSKLSDKQLEWYIETSIKNLDDPAKEKYQAKEHRWLDALQAEQDRRAGGDDERSAIESEDEYPGEIE